MGPDAMILVFHCYQGSTSRMNKAWISGAVLFIILTLLIHPIFRLIVAFSLATGINVCPIPIPTEAGPNCVYITLLAPESFLGMERHPLAMAANLRFLAAITK